MRVVLPGEPDASVNLNVHLRVVHGRTERQMGRHGRDQVELVEGVAGRPEPRPTRPRWPARWRRACRRSGASPLGRCRWCGRTARAPWRRPRPTRCRPTGRPPPPRRPGCGPGRERTGRHRAITSESATLTEDRVTAADRRDGSRSLLVADHHARQIRGARRTTSSPTPQEQEVGRSPAQDDAGLPVEQAVGQGQRSAQSDRAGDSSHLPVREAAPPAARALHTGPPARRPAPSAGRARAPPGGRSPRARRSAR